VLRHFTIVGVDELEGAPNDMCGAANEFWAADGYCINDPRAGYPTAQAYFCDEVFEDHAEVRSELQCKDFQIGGNEGDEVSGLYRITEEMDYLGASILHEMLHMNAIGSATGETNEDSPGAAIIKDITGAYGPLGSRMLVQNRLDDVSPGLAFLNADSYVWYAVKCVWTNECSAQLDSERQHRCGRFDEPPAE